MGFNPFKAMVVVCYLDAYFLVLWFHDNYQYTICDCSNTICVVTFSNFNLLWVSKIHAQIGFYNFRYKYVFFVSFYKRLNSLKENIKEVINNLETDRDNLKLDSISTVYQDNYVTIVVSNHTRMNSTLYHFSIK